MPDNPLVLYYDGPDRALALQARAGAEELLKRWPGAEVRALVSSSDVRLDLRCSRDEWILGLEGGIEILDHVHCIDPTPDASIVMQVWREMSVCEFCKGKYAGTRNNPYSDGCAACNSATPPAPPWHVRYIDDAVCGRVHDTSEASAFMAYLRSFLLDKVPWQHIIRTRRGSADGVAIIKAGRAILRARERWDAEERDWVTREAKRRSGLADDVDRLCTERDEARRLYELACVDQTDPADLVGALITERNEALALLEDLEPLQSDCEAALSRCVVYQTQLLALGTERDEALAEVERLRAGLGEAKALLDEAAELDHRCPDQRCDVPDYLDNPDSHKRGCRYVALCELAGVGR